MGLSNHSRASGSAWIASVWTSRSTDVSQMAAVANETWGLVFWHQGDAPFAAVVGPETRAATAPVPEDASFVGIQFAVGTALRALPVPGLVDGGVVLPGVRRRSFRLDGRRWETPTADDAEALVARLVRGGTLVRDPVVTDVMRGRRPGVGDRTVERRFRAATGLTRGAVRQIARTRDAAQLLRDGLPVAEVVGRLGFYDEPHLARALRRHVGRTARELREGVGGAIALDDPQRSTS